MEQEWRIGLEDIRIVEIECPLCHTAVVLDMTATHDLAEKAFTPKACPSCLEKYETAVCDNIDALRRAYRGMAPFADRIRLRGKR